MTQRQCWQVAGLLDPVECVELYVPGEPHPMPRHRPSKRGGHKPASLAVRQYREALQKAAVAKRAQLGWPQPWMGPVSVRCYWLFKRPVDWTYGAGCMVAKDVDNLEKHWDALQPALIANDRQIVLVERAIKVPWPYAPATLLVLYCHPRVR